MADARLSVQWDQVAWILMNVIKAVCGRKARVTYAKANPYESFKEKQRLKRKTSSDYKSDLLEMARGYVNRRQAV